MDELKAQDKKLKELNLLKDLADHAGIQVLLEEFRKSIEMINDVLIHNITLTDNDRHYLFTKRDAAERIIDIFSNVDKQINAINNQQSEK